MAAKDYVVPMNHHRPPSAHKEADKKGRRPRGHYMGDAWETVPPSAEVLPVLIVYVFILLITTFLLLLLLVLTTKPSSRNASSSSPAPFADTNTATTAAGVSTISPKGPHRMAHGAGEPSSPSPTKADEEPWSNEDADSYTRVSPSEQAGGRIYGEQLEEQLLWRHY